MAGGEEEGEKEEEGKEEGEEGEEEGLSECCFHFLSMFRLVLSLFFWVFFSQKTT